MSEPDPQEAHGTVHVVGHDLELRWNRRGDRVELELVPTEPEAADVAEPDRVEAVVGAVRSLLGDPRLTGAELVLAAAHPADRDLPLPGAVAEALGFIPRRLLLQLRRPLPVPADHPARPDDPPAVRPIGPEDDAAWIRVNNRAFADHPDQGSESPETLAARRAEGWYDPSGFLVLDDPDRPGELAGFCWTKEHPPTPDEPALGEIYVIGVDPDRHGRGLGAALVLAGLDHLADRGLPVANLYVEGDNDAALGLYDRLGFEVHERRRVYAP